jgi:hypothetical protein
MKNGTSAAGPSRRPAGLAPRRAAAGAGAVVGLICLAAAAGCSPGTPPPAAATPPAAASASAAATSATAAARPTPSPGTATAPASPAGVPTLGQLAGDFAHGTGFGEVKPSEIFNGGDPSGLVTHVVWSSWGGAQATATGTAEYVGPNQTVAQGTEETATVVAFDLGTCDGKLMYQAVEWYFPQNGQSFSPSTYENICTGSYVGSP